MAAPSPSTAPPMSSAARGLHEEVSYRDQQLVPDPSTPAPRVPWLEDTAKVICDARWAPGEPIAATPRSVLAEPAATGPQDGLRGHVRPGVRVLPAGSGDQGPAVRRRAHLQRHPQSVRALSGYGLLDTLQAAGIDVITHNCEYSPSQYEINFGPGVGLEGADKAFTFKNAIKELAHRNGYLATFMSKPATDMAGCGCHVHVSLIDRKTGKNAFFTARARKDGLNPAHPPLRFRAPDPRQGDAGADRPDAQLLPPAEAAHLRPLEHLLGRRGPHGHGAHQGRPGEANCHIEMRAASGLSNPYLSVAAVIAAGLLGLKEQGPNCRRSPRVLPRTIPSTRSWPAAWRSRWTALEERQAACSKLLGEDFVKLFTTVKRGRAGPLPQPRHRLGARRVFGALLTVSRN